MQWAYDLTGAEPIIKDELVYDSASITRGELLQLGTTAYTAAADAGVCLVTAAPTTVMANQATNAVGLSLATRTTNATANTIPPSLGIPTTQYPTGVIPSVAAAGNVTTGVICTSKVIVNPFAVYRAEVTTADALAIASSSDTSNICITGLAASSMNGAYVYFCASAGPNFGSIRKVVSSATAGTLLLDAALTATVTTADKVILIAEKNLCPNTLSTASAGTSRAIMIGQTTVGAGNGATKLRVVENLIDRGLGVEILRQRVQGQKDIGSVQAKKTKFYQEIMLLNRAFA